MGIIAKVNEVSALVGDLEKEIFYGLNLRITLVDHATEEELKALKRLVAKAKEIREQILARSEKKVG